jgi:hypothetical protein
MATATLSAKFRISIPKEVCEQQHWSVGQELVFITKGKGVSSPPLNSPTLKVWPEAPTPAFTETGKTGSDARTSRTRHIDP